MNRHKAPSILIVGIYVVALAMTTALMVFWVLVVQRFQPEINQLISRFGVGEWHYFHVFMQSTGAAFFFLVIIALTYLLAVSLSERRYSRKKDEFLAHVTHELKSPVAAIKLHAQTLQQDGLSPAERASMTRYIVEQSDRIGALVDNLLESSRLLAGGGGELRPINLRAFFHDYQQAVRGRFDLRQIDLTFEVQTRAVVMATSEGLQRVMDNLIDNALRFTGAGGRVRCEVRDGSAATEIVVADDGVGIPKRELSKIFDRFYRLGREIAGRRKGTGLGLWIVRQLVEEMRGTIRAISGHGEPGARFEIQLPKVEGAPPPAGRTEDGEPAVAAAAEGADR
ncbi:MAG: sensor histidine kinase [Acidobacteria bacterium]|nr:MAG: sensor histidine kinase [Acidobacteriota bacterium]